MRYRPVAATLLVVQALAITTPLAALDGYVIGAQTIGKALAFVRVGDVVGQGLAQALTPLTTLLLLLAAWGVGHRSRGVGALVLQPVVLAFALVPFLLPLTAVDVLPWGSALLVVLVVMTSAALVGVIAESGQDGQRTVRRWWWLAAFGGGIVVLALIGAGNRSLPTGPASLLASPGEGAPVQTVAPGPAIPQNPGLAANPFNSIHNDSWATDSYPDLAGPTGATGQVDSLFTGGDCATLAFDSEGRLVTLCSSLTAVIAYVVEPTDLSVIHQSVVGSRSPDLTDFSGGGYFILDDRDRIVFPAAGGVIRVLDTRSGIVPAADIPVAQTLVPDEKVTAVMPGWRGGYWYVGSKGTVGRVPRSGGNPRSVNLGGETIENSFAVTSDAAYVVTGAALYRLESVSGAPTVAWQTPYDAGGRLKPGQTSRASGTTPTVFADGRLVAISDNADPQMAVVVFDTATGSVTCRQPVFGPQTGATENSLIAAGNRLIVENNYGYRPAITATAAGHSTTPGLAALDVDPRDGRCRPAWYNDTITIPSLVSKATLPGDQVLTYTKPADWRGIDAWYFTGVDLTSGQVAWWRLAGTGIPFNNHYASAALSPAGDLLVGTVNGVARLRDE